MIDVEGIGAIVARGLTPRQRQALDTGDLHDLSHEELRNLVDAGLAVGRDHVSGWVARIERTRGRSGSQQVITQAKAITRRN